MKKTYLFIFAAVVMNSVSLQAMVLGAPGKSLLRTKELRSYIYSEEPASEFEVLKTVKDLLDQGADASARIRPLSAKGPNPPTNLLLCEIASNPTKRTFASLIPLLVAYGANVNQYPDCGRGDHALRCAITQNDHACMLLKCGAQVNMEDLYEEYTPFMLGNKETAKLLLSYGTILTNGKIDPSKWQREIYTEYQAFLEFKRGMLGLKPVRNEHGKLQWAINANGRPLYAAVRKEDEQRLPAEVVEHIGEFLGYPEPRIYTKDMLALLKS